MILATTAQIHGKRIVKNLGLVHGNTIRALHVGMDIMAGLKNLVGGEVSEYTKLMGESREQALDRMVDDAKRLGANAIVGIQFSTSEIMNGASELLAYGTAVLVEDESN
ncbi:YbjQ family protein [candidate division KSB1 bacterium]|nr:YbjQ family protein [candidate division KSB1 bacterium]